jgi:hypothetical protein
MQDNHDHSVSTGTLNGLRANAAASAGELREFLERTRGKNPQEVLGLVAQSGLTWALLQATIGCVALLAVLTFVPFVWSKLGGAPAATPKPAPEQAAKPEAPAVANPPRTEPERTATGTNDTKPADPDKLNTKLGESGTKTGTPKSPVDDIDKLIDK